MSAGKTTSFLSAVAILFPKASSRCQAYPLLLRAVSSLTAARRNDDAPLATDVFDAGQCDFPANYKHALHHETFKGCSINYGIRNVQKESAYVLVAFRFLARPFVSFVSHIARYAPSSTDKSSSLRNQKSTQPNF